MMKKVLFLILIVPLLMGGTACKTSSGVMPDRGICAHRGAMETHPENTLAAFKEAVRLGAHMIEFDVRMTKDGHLVILHDETVDRTTNGKGKISEITIEEVMHLDAGSWKSEQFTGEKIPTFIEALEVMPENIWLNVHIKGGKRLGEKVARVITDEERVHQAFLACGSEAARGAKEINRDLMICNMERQNDRDGYIKETVRQKSQFIQLLKGRTNQQLDAEIASLKQHHIRINYCCSDAEEEVIALFNSGVDFILTDRLSEMLEVAASVGIEPATDPDHTIKYIGKQIVIQKVQAISQDITEDYFPAPKNGGVYVIAHRGVHNDIPENSLPAYQKAIDLGCDFIEIDVRETSDGSLVSVHNATVDAYIKEGGGKVGDFTLAELKTLDIGERIGPQWKNTRIPTIEEILQLCHGKIGIYLDLKEPLVPELVKIIKEYEMERDIVWYIPASYMDAIKEVKSTCYLCIPMPDPGPKENITEVVKQVQPLVIASDMGELSEEYMSIAREYGVKVFVDEETGDESEWNRILSWGVDGIQTDKPQDLIRFLLEREN